jgi:hypothetical protein
VKAGDRIAVVLARYDVSVPFVLRTDVSTHNLFFCSSVTGAADDGNFNPNYGVSEIDIGLSHANKRIVTSHILRCIAAQLFVGQLRVRDARARLQHQAH